MDYENLVLLKYLLSVERIGPNRIQNLLNKFKSFQNIFSATYSELVRTELISDTIARNIISNKKNLDDIRTSTDKEINSLEKLGAQFTTFWDEDYPNLLKTIFYPPLIFYYYGQFDALDKNSFAIVGTRQPTNYGKTFAAEFARDLSLQKITIVSGLARGIDSIAHESALNNNGRSIAVIGSGLDIIYPPENRKLFERMKENGVIISEFPLGTKPDAQNFPRRNRIISGISLGTLVVETKINGGAMQTAAYALDQNREVFALPGNLNSKFSEGTNFLIQRGEAKLIRNTEDILIELNLKLKPKVGINIPIPKPDMNLFEEKIYNSLTDTPKHIDSIADETSLATSDCLVHLLSLEFKNAVRQFPGKMFAKL